MKREEFVELLKDLELNKKEFAEISCVPYPTVLSWGVARKGKVLNIPFWVKEFLYYYAKARKFDMLKDQICSEIFKQK